MAFGGKAAVWWLDRVIGNQETKGLLGLSSAQLNCCVWTMHIGDWPPPYRYKSSQPNSYYSQDIRSKKRAINLWECKRRSKMRPYSWVCRQRKHAKSTRVGNRVPRISAQETWDKHKVRAVHLTLVSVVFNNRQHYLQQKPGRRARQLG